MSFNANKYLAVGTKVRVTEPMDVPEDSKLEDDHGRISPSLKKRMQTMFFKGDKKLTAEVVYISKESEREKLRRKGLIKVRIKDQAGCMLVLTADPSKLMACR